MLDLLYKMIVDYLFIETQIILAVFDQFTSFLQYKVSFLVLKSSCWGGEGRIALFILYSST